jgi:hypothetical protein
LLFQFNLPAADSFGPVSEGHLVGLRSYIVDLQISWFYDVYALFVTMAIKHHQVDVPLSHVRQSPSLLIIPSSKTRQPLVLSKHIRTS